MDLHQCKNILRDESYTGVLINRHRVMKDGKVSRTPEEQQLRHEGIYPVLICREQWEEVQRQMEQRSPRRPEGSNKPRAPLCRTAVLRGVRQSLCTAAPALEGQGAGEYVCKGYHGGGKEICSPHRVHEKTLDATVRKHLAEMLESQKRQIKQCSEIQKMWALREPILDVHISALEVKIKRLEQEIDRIAMEIITIDRPS